MNEEFNNNNTVFTYGNASTCLINQVSTTTIIIQKNSKVTYDPVLKKPLICESLILSEGAHFSSTVPVKVNNFILHENATFEPAGIIEIIGDQPQM